MIKTGKCIKTCLLNKELKYVETIAFAAVNVTEFTALNELSEEIKPYPLA